MNAGFGPAAPGAACAPVRNVAVGPQRLRIGSWPGREATHNQFIPIVLGALEAAGAEIVDMPDVAAIRAGTVDVVLLHWVEKVFWEADSAQVAALRILQLLRKLALRPRRVKVIWIAHNLAPHESRGFRKLVWRPYLRALSMLIDGAVTLSPGTVPILRAGLDGFRAKPIGFAWHPLYPDATVSAAQRSGDRAAFGWGEAERVVGFCGQIRPYKGVDELIAAFRRTTAPDMRLLIAGAPLNDAIAADLAALAGDDARIRLDLNDLDADAFRRRLGVCDLIAAPFHRYLHSGSIMHALSAGRPVLTPGTPFSRALRDEVSEAWLRLYDGALTPEMLTAALRQPVAHAPDLDAFAPAQTAERLLDMVGKVGGRPAMQPVGL